MSKKNLILIVFVIALIIFSGTYFVMSQQKTNIEPPTSSEKTNSSAISDEEKELIKDWIIENDLNEFGDPKDTVYTGGTPLFDEATGKTIDKYDYILQKHKDRPWNE